jgi:hypothetical protein
MSNLDTHNIDIYYTQLYTDVRVSSKCIEWLNVRGEPAFSVMAAGYFCEKSGWLGKVEDVKPVLLKK